MYCGAWGKVRGTSPKRTALNLLRLFRTFNALLATGMKHVYQQQNYSAQCQH